MSEHHWDAQCNDCPAYKVRFEKADIDNRIFPLFDLYLMVHGGAPIGINDLEPWQWMMLGIIREEKEQLQWRMLSLNSGLAGPQGPPRT